MKPNIITPHKDMDAWLKSFPVLNDIMVVVMSDVQAGKEIKPATYLAMLPNSLYGKILQPRLYALIWMETGVLDNVPTEWPSWGTGDLLTDAAGKQYLVVMGVWVNTPGALLFDIGAGALTWETPCLRPELAKVINE